MYPATIHFFKRASLYPTIMWRKIHSCLWTTLGTHQHLVKQTWSKVNLLMAGNDAARGMGHLLQGHYFFDFTTRPFQTPYSLCHILTPNASILCSRLICLWKRSHWARAIGSCLGWSWGWGGLTPSHLQPGKVVCDKRITGNNMSLKLSRSILFYQC